MSKTSTTSPFRLSADESEWIIWEQKSSLLDLQRSAPIDRQPVFEEDSMADSLSYDSVPLSSPTKIERRQYNAILSRMNQASRHATNYSSWSS